MKMVSSGNPASSSRRGHLEYCNERSNVHFQTDKSGNSAKRVPVMTPMMNSNNNKKFSIPCMVCR